MMNSSSQFYENWKQIQDKRLQKELNTLTLEEVEDNFFGHLSFGTAGLRGKMGFGTNRINEVTVCKLANAVGKYFKQNNLKSIVVGFDTRNNSKKFSRIFAKTLTANGIKVFLFKNFVPTPVVSFAITELKVDMGIMITASHNNKIYNGIKVSGADGIQISGDVEKTLNSLYLETDEVNAYNQFLKIKSKNNNIFYLDKELKQKFLGKFYQNSFNANVKIIYTPLNGTAYKYVVNALKKSGFKNVIIPKSQKIASGEFKTCPNPNPEFKEVYSECLNLTKSFDADLIVATDPDGDRLGVMIKTYDGYKLLTGNEVGFLLLNYIYEKKEDKKDLFAVSTVVSSPLFFTMCEKLGINYKKSLTGFKNLGKAKKILEDEYSTKGFILAYEESCGYVVKNNFYDKDGIFALIKICELASSLKSKNSSLDKYLNELYEKFGYVYSLNSHIIFEGNNALNDMNNVIENLRKKGIKKLNNSKIIKKIDYYCDETGLDKSNFIEYKTEKFSFIIRPSGTEPKLKFYIHASGSNFEECKLLAEQVLIAIKKEILNLSEW